MEGDTLSYDLYIPAASPPAAGYPFALLLHGFGGNKSHLSGHAVRLQQMGIVVLCPEMSPLTRRPWEESQLRNIKQAANHVNWMLSDSKDTPNIDRERILLTGHSAGFAVLFETAIALQKEGTSVACLLSLDGVPWPRTIETAKDLDVTKTRLVSIRCEPGSWNKNGELHSQLVVPIVARKCGEMDTSGALFVLDIFIPGSAHGDPIDPPQRQWLFKMLNLTGKPGCREAFKAIIDAIGRDLTGGQLLTGNAKDAEGLEKTERELERLSDKVKAQRLAG